MSPTTVSRADRERMAEDLKALGLYATSTAVRAGSATLAEGVAHVRDYCLPNVLRAVEEVRARNAASPPIPGTVGASMLGNCEIRRNELQRFLDEWAAYDFDPQPEQSSGSGEGR